MLGGFFGIGLLPVSHEPQPDLERQEPEDNDMDTSSVRSKELIKVSIKSKGIAKKSEDGDIKSQRSTKSLKKVKASSKVKK